ncbi:MAG: hypothetical protein RLZZ28_414 [Bacteroidota bacterium]|jgi:hypothetical protein
MQTFLKNYKFGLIGLLAGGITGFLYWKYIGCASGTCIISSKPVNSSLYGAIMGALALNLFDQQKSK